MVPVMIGPLILLAASVSPDSRPAPPAPAGAPAFRPTSSVTAHATVSIRVISGVSFGASQASGAAGASRRTTELSGAAGSMLPAELLEFQ
jgi:hypothetical protein